MLEQTRNAKQAMKNAGFKEVKVRTYRKANGEYELTATITCFDSLEMQLSLVEAAKANGLKVTMYQREDGTFSYPSFELAQVYTEEVQEKRETVEEKLARAFSQEEGTFVEFQTKKERRAAMRALLD